MEKEKVALNNAASILGKRGGQSTSEAKRKAAIENGKLGGKKMVKSKMDYVLVRTYSAGVFTGYLASREGKEVVLKDARRIYYWSGAASLSQLSQDGTSDPANCKFPCTVDSIILTEAIEIINVTKKAQESIENVPVWQS